MVGVCSGACVHWWVCGVVGVCTGESVNWWVCAAGKICALVQMTHLGFCSSSGSMH